LSALSADAQSIASVPFPSCHSPPSSPKTQTAQKQTAIIYKSFIHQKLVAHKKTNLNELNQRATCLQISQHGLRVKHWGDWGEQDETVSDNLKLRAYLMF